MEILTNENNIEAIIWDLDGTLIDSDLYVVLNYVHMYQSIDLVIIHI